MSSAHPHLTLPLPLLTAINNRANFIAVFPLFCSLPPGPHPLDSSQTHSVTNTRHITLPHTYTHTYKRLYPPMEELIAQQIEQLREEQARLEGQLDAHQQQPGGVTLGVGPVPGTTCERRVAEMPLYRVNNAGPLTMPTAAAAATTIGGVQPLHERLRELDALKRKYQQEAGRAMAGYFAAVSDHPRYEAERKAKLNSARPFSFQSRELLRPPSTRAARVEADRRQQDDKARQDREGFRAAAVPATTFMDKYSLMVEEWGERKAAAHHRASERAAAARDDAAFLRLSAQGLRHTREEIMGAVYDGRTGRPVTRSEQRQRRERAQSADAGSGRGGRRVLVSTQPEDIPLEVRMRLWPAIQDHEQVRHERLKLTALERKDAADAHFRESMPLLSSPAPQRLEAFGIGQPVLAPAAATATLGVGGVPVPGQQPLYAAPVLVPGVPGVPLAPPPPPPAAGIPGGVPGPLAYSPPGVVPRPSSTSVSVPFPTPAPATAAPAVAVRVNPNCTFRPRVKPGVPDFKALWADERARLAEAKRARPTTAPRPFDLQPSARDGIVRGRPTSRAVSLPAAPRAPSAKRSHQKQPPGAVSRNTTAEGAPTATTTTTPSAVPRGTRAHALRTEAVYSRYISASVDGDDATADDEAALREATRRRREVGRRLGGGGYLTDASSAHERVIKEKVRALRAATKESEAAAVARLEEMRARVASLPPLFAEPVGGANDESRARAEAEQAVVGLLKQSGLDAATIRDILVNSGSSGEGEGEGVTATAAAAVDEATAAAATAEVPSGDATDDKPGSPAAAVDIKTKKKSGGGSSDSSSSSNYSSSFDSSFSSSSSSSSSTTAATSPSRTASAAPLLLPSAAPRALSSSSAAPSAVSLLSPALSVPAPVPVPVGAAKVDSDYDDDSFEDSSSSNSD